MPKFKELIEAAQTAGELRQGDAGYVLDLFKQSDECRTLEARTITGEKVAQSIPMSVTGLMFAFVDECRTMSHADRASTALTLAEELKKMAEEETRESIAQN